MKEMYARSTIISSDEVRYAGGDGSFLFEDINWKEKNRRWVYRLLDNAMDLALDQPEADFQEVRGRRKRSLLLQYEYRPADFR